MLVDLCQFFSDLCDRLSRDRILEISHLPHDIDDLMAERISGACGGSSVIIIIRFEIARHRFERNAIERNSSR
jgi:hypothetical protein